MVVLKYKYYFKALTHLIFQLNNIPLNVLYFCEEKDVEKVKVIINQLKENLSNKEIKLAIQNWKADHYRV